MRRKKSLRNRIIRWYCAEFDMPPGTLDTKLGPIVLREFTVLWAIFWVAVLSLVTWAFWMFCTGMILLEGVI